MSHCLWCSKTLHTIHTWSNLFLPNIPKWICSKCQSQLELIGESFCLTCNRPKTGQQCSDCLFWDNYYSGNDPLIKNISVYTYNSFMKDIIAKWKYRGDYQLGYIFKESFIHVYRKRILTMTDSNDFMIVPIPLSRERANERAFNQANLLAGFLGGKIHPILMREHGEKQSKKTRKERISVKNPFNLHLPVNKSVILVDDIYTTGRTIRHAAERLKANGCPKVYAFTLIRG